MAFFDQNWMLSPRRSRQSDVVREARKSGVSARILEKPNCFTGIGIGYNDKIAKQQESHRLLTGERRNVFLQFEWSAQLWW